VRFGKRAQECVGKATRKAFYGIIDSIKALWWLRVGHQLGGDACARAAKRFGVSVQQHSGSYTSSALMKPRWRGCAEGLAG